MVQSDEHFHVVCRNVERTALAAGLVSKAEQWRFGSLYNWLGGSCGVTLAISKVAQLAGTCQPTGQ